jgi:hypothetical protein
MPDEHKAKEKTFEAHWITALNGRLCTTMQEKVVRPKTRIAEMTAA